MIIIIIIHKMGNLFLLSERPPNESFVLVFCVLCTFTLQFCLQHFITIVVLVDIRPLISFIESFFLLLFSDFKSQIYIHVCVCVCMLLWLPLVLFYLAVIYRVVTYQCHWVILISCIFRYELDLGIAQQSFKKRKPIKTLKNVEEKRQQWIQHAIIALYCLK